MTRWDFRFSADDSDMSKCYCRDGKYVAYSDVGAELAEKAERIAELEKRIEAMTEELETAQAFLAKRPEADASPRQAETLRAIVDMTKRDGFQPSFKEIGDHLGVTTGCVAFHLDALERKGYISRSRGGARRISILRTLPEVEQ